MAKSYYDILGVSKSASDDEIKSAYRKMAKKYHPDLNAGNEEASAKFKEVNEAYGVLSDSQKKANYDQFGTAEPNMGGFGGGGGGFGGFGGGGGGFGGSIFEDIVNMFGGEAGGSAPPSDITQNVTLTFEEAAFGVAKDIHVSRTEQCVKCNGTGAKNGTAYDNCAKCNGTGKIRFTQDTMFGRVVNTRACPDCKGTGKKIKEPCEECRGKGDIHVSKTIKINIPAGIDNGQVLTVSGEGEGSRHSDRRGSLQLVIKVLAHKVFVRRNYDIYVNVPITFTQAILGDEIDIPTLKGTVKLKVREGTQTGTVERMKGYGIKQLRRETNGDMYVTLNIEVPKNLKGDQKELLKKLHGSIGVGQYDKVKGFNK